MRYMMYLSSLILVGCGIGLEYKVEGKFEGFDMNIKGIERKSEKDGGKHYFSVWGDYNGLEFDESIDALEPCPLRMEIRAIDGELSFFIEDEDIPHYPKAVASKCALDYANAIEKKFRQEYIERKSAVESYK